MSIHEIEKIMGEPDYIKVINRISSDKISVIYYYKAPYSKIPFAYIFDYSIRFDINKNIYPDFIDYED